MPQSKVFRFCELSVLNLGLLGFDVVLFKRPSILTI